MAANRGDQEGRCRHDALHGRWFVDRPLVTRSSRCGSLTCACHSDPGRLHGPYLSWTRKVDGKTVTRNLSPDQVDRYRAWFDNAKRLRQLVGELEELSASVAAEAEGWDSPH